MSVLLYLYPYFLPCVFKNETLTNKARDSATITAHQTPSVFNRIGKTRMLTIWNKNIRKKEIIAEITPLFNAVKKEELQTLNPSTRYAKA